MPFSQQVFNALPGGLERRRIHRLHVERVDVLVVDEILEKRLQGDEDLSVLVDAGEVHALGFHDADDLAGHAPDQNHAAEGVLLAEEFFRDSRPDHDHLAKLTAVFFRDESSLLNVEIPNVLISRRRPGDQDGRERDAFVTDGKVLVAGRTDSGDVGDAVGNRPGVIQGEICCGRHEPHVGAVSPGETAAHDEQVLAEALRLLFGLDRQGVGEVEDDDQGEGAEEDAQYGQRRPQAEIGQRTEGDAEVEGEPFHPRIASMGLRLAARDAG